MGPFIMNVKLSWRVTAKGGATQVLVFSGKVAGRFIADPEVSKRRLDWLGLGESRKQAAGSTPVHVGAADQVHFRGW